MTKLTPAAQAVAKAALYVSSFDPEDYPSQSEEIAAAVLRAVADQVVPEEPLHFLDERWQLERDTRQKCRNQLLAIADELKPSSPIN
jgi:hypothetical protein